MIKQWIYDLRRAAHEQEAVAQLRALESRLPSPRARFAIPFVFRGRGYFKVIAPRQNPVEIESLYERVCDLRPRRVLEIGTARGGTLYLWTQAATPDAQLISVDLPGGEFGGAYPPCRVPFYQQFARPQQSMNLLRADSHAADTLAKVKDLLRCEKFDFAFIDGDHTYAGVKQDFEMYGQLVRPGGLVAFHDILPRPDMPDIQVDKFWNELKAASSSAVEFIGPESMRRIGIGLVTV